MIKMSWSRKLFLKINSHVGKNPTLDHVMKFASSSLILFFGFFVLVWAQVALEPVSFKLFVKMLLTALAFGLGFNWALGLVWRHPRPIVEFPNIKTLSHTLTTFKSFPSDHATMSFILFFMTVIFGASFWLIILFLCCAVTVSVGRVYCGVHYPRDIVGGLVFASIMAICAGWVLSNITQPIYGLLIK